MPHRWSSFQARRARIAAESVRLASKRVSKDSDVAVAVSTISGQPITSSITLQELLRRPHLHYRYSCYPMVYLGMTHFIKAFRQDRSSLN